MRLLTAALVWIIGVQMVALAQPALPIVAVHDSEFTRALESIPAVASTPTGAGTTGFEWWPTDWHYFVMPDSLKECFRSDGTAFTTLGDSNITAGILLTNGQPKYPILLSLASEAISDGEIAAFTNYVAAGGFLLVGSSSFSRNTNGITRGDFAFANALGLHSSTSGLTNWATNNNITKLLEHRLVSNLPYGQLSWRIPSSSEETSWGLSPAHPFLAAHDVWRVVNADATVLARGDATPFLTIKQYGKGYFIYCAAFQPLIGHGGFSPSTYAYVILRRAIEWAFETQNMPVPKLSPWPYPYDAALMVRHDLENFTNEVAAIESSAQFEFTNHALGDYYFCTGTLRDDAWPTFDTNNMVAGLRRAVTNYGATIGPHNGGLKNPNNNALVRGDYDYWHWGTDEALATNPPGYASGKAYAIASVSNSFHDVESWLSGITNGLRSWVQCYFNGTREDSYDLQAQLGVNITGDQKIGPFPHWTLSTKTTDKRYAMLTEPVSDWFVGGLVAQSLDPFHPPGVQTTNTLHAAIDFYYGLGGLVNFYSHTLSTGLGPAGFLASEYVTYSVNTNLHPRLWGANGVLIYQWWLQRSNAQVNSSYHTNANGQSVATLAIVGNSDTNSSVEIVTPQSGAVYALQVFTNNVLAGVNEYRTNGQTIKLRVGTSVTNAQFSYFLGPKAVSDSYIASVGSALNISAPGVLANDGLGAIGGVTLAVVAGPAHGTLNLSTNGAFIYTPTNGFSGFDSFTYSLTDAASDVSTASVSLQVSAGDVFLSDDFTRGSDPGPLAPWVANTGNWSVTGGAMRGTNTLSAYANAYLTNSWQDYCVEARVRFDSGAFGGGLGGRVHPAGGAHYAAWIYPEGSPGGSQLLKLVKFQDWNIFGYNGSLGSVMAQASLGTVGTNYHTVKIGFRGTRIAVYFDGIELISVSDVEVQPNLSGGVSLDFWTDTVPYFFTADDVVVKPLAVSDTYAATEDTALTVPAPGVLTNDTGIYGTNLTASLVTGPAHGLLSLGTDGSFTYTPFTNFNGTDTFIYQASDSGTNLGLATVSIIVAPVNDPPVLSPQIDRTIAELTPLIVTNTATDPDLPANVLTYLLLNPPTGAVIDTNTGVITWTPSEAQGPSTNFMTTVVTDNGTPPLSATNTFKVTVTEVNAAPVLPIQADQTIAELTPLVVTNTATDSDLPANVLTYLLMNPPIGVAIGTNTGVITWTPTEAQGPSTNFITTIVTDNGTPPLSATNTFKVTVTEVNSAPVLPIQADQTIAELTPLVVTNTATDSDLPANVLTYFLLNPPAGAAIGTNTGVINWTPSEAQGPSTNFITTVVTDNGTPPLSATNTFKVIVTESNFAPVLPIQADQTIAELTPLVVTNTATDSDLPANVLTYLLMNPPIGVAIGTNTGVITWTPTEAQGPSTNFITTVVTDNGTPPLSATNTFKVTVTEVNSAPVLPVQADQTIAELTPLIVTNTATDPDLPANVLIYLLLNPPAGAAIGTNTGVITWTPTEAQGPSTNFITTVVTDNGTPPLSATNTFKVTVTEVNSAPVLPVQADQTIAELTPLVVTNTATDSDLPANVLTYLLLNPPAGSVIDPNTGVISWTPTEAQGPSTNFITTVVTDNGSPPLSATNTFKVIVTEVNSAPVLPVQADQTIAELTPLVVTNATADSDLPANVLTYFLLNPPAGAAIGTNTGVINWTPSEVQGPSTNFITTVVTDNGTPPLSATNTFKVTVTEVNSAPVLPIQADQTIAELTPLVVTNTATDSDLPANVLTYLLLNPPAGAAIDTNTGVINWTPTEAQGPSTNFITTVVTDNGSPPLSATNTFKVTVTEVNSPPVLPIQADQTIAELTPLIVTNTATDSDLPANVLTYLLLNPPAGAAIGTNTGVITWTPTEAQGPSTNFITTVVTDNGTPPLSATNTFKVTVTEVNSAPVLPIQADQTIAELTPFVVTNTATDSDLPANVLSYLLLNPPGGAAINTNTGVITWTPTEAQGPSTNFITTVVTDNGSPPLSATNTFKVTVTEVNSTPVLPVQADRTISAQATLVVTNAATDADLPANILSYALIESPAGAQIDTNGIILWMPGETNAPSTNIFTTFVTDDGLPPLSATNHFTVIVSAPPTPPLIVSISLTNDVAVITWSSSPGGRYTVQYKETPFDAEWIPHAPDVVATDVTATATVAGDGAMQRYFRVVLQP